ncbi:pleckstrin homology domain-containing family A member 4 isoform X2 [Poecilia formosa]|uniref:pleckstrin homology domain-containing family A member 4 isoform X2 n=1 Tax=Poecilia formosa TaxID=48698 RepID=UPI0007B7CA35|nr:PREDICTED: pleckstrin homology domain-containing family A member 4 isoform X2 [Poecilia formosa]
MEMKDGGRRPQMLRMDDQDRVSQASSVATISYFPVIKESDGKVQTFGKRCQAAKRDPNCPVVIRGWLNKKDSSGLKLWKRRWFVLSNYCLYYYKDSREETVLGSIPLPSYKILFCTPRECKNRKFTFKVVHQGMRSYFFSADTQEDMLGWVRALSQSAAMEPDTTMNRRCSSYQDFTQLGGSSESMDFPRSPTEEECPPQKHRHVSRTLSEPGQLSGRVGRSQSEHRGRRSVHYRNRSPSNRTPSPPDPIRRRTASNREDDSYDENSAQAAIVGSGSLGSRGQLGSRPHTPVGRVDIRPHDDPVTVYYTPASPKLEFKSAPTTPVTERWQNLSKPAALYGSVHHTPSGRRPLAKSHSTGADLLPPLPPAARAAHVSNPSKQPRQLHVPVSVLPQALASKSDQRDLQPIRPLESDADAVLTRLCGCDKLLQSLSVELTQLQMDKDSVQCALEVSRLQVEEWRSQGPRALEEALTQKALLQEELVTIRARVCDVSLEMERVWSQYERMESELSVIHSHLQHISNFGMPQEQCQAQRELWMMEDILDGLKVNRDYFCFLLGLQTHHMFQFLPPGPPASPPDGLPVGLPAHSDVSPVSVSSVCDKRLQDLEQEPPLRPPLPLELQESQQAQDPGRVWPESPYERIYEHPADPADRRGNSQPDLLNVKAQRDATESQSGSKWIPPETANQPTKMKLKMSEAEQIERMKRNQERLANKRKPPVATPGPQNQSSDTRQEAPFPLRVTRVVTAVLPSSLVARRVSVEDPPAELDAPLPEQILPETQQKPTEPSKKLLSKPARGLLTESPDSNQAAREPHQDQAAKKASRKHPSAYRSSRMEPLLEVSRGDGSESPRSEAQHLTGSGRGQGSADVKAAEGSSAADFDLTPGVSSEQREAKLRRVERIRERVMRSAARESSTTDSQRPIRRERKEVHQARSDSAEGKWPTAGSHGCLDDVSRSGDLQGSTSQSCHEVKSKSRVQTENRAQHSGRAEAANNKSRRSASPYHISSMTVYQNDGAKGFISCNDEEQENPEGLAAEDKEEKLKSSHLRTKWFLSTNQWQGFIPLQMEPLSIEENEEPDAQPCSDDANDLNEMSATVTESLQKMKENHSLFYKIACDISISDSDIKSDDQTSCRPEEEETLVIEEPARTGNVGTPSHLESLDGRGAAAENKSLELTREMQDETLVDPTSDPSELSPAEQFGREDEVKVSETGACVPETDSTQALEGHTKTEEKHRVKKESEDLNTKQEGCEETKKRSRGSKEKKTDEENRGNRRSIGGATDCDGGRIIRSASFGKPRVTVLRTSL